MSNVSPNQITLHFGAAPNTRNGTYTTTFQVFEWLQSSGNWSAVPSGPNFTAPSYTEYIGAFNQADANGQHSYLAYDINTEAGQGVIARYWEVWGGSATDDEPPLSIIYRDGSDSTVLQFCSLADTYLVYEYHGSTSIQTYMGPDCNILVHRTIGGVNQYKVSSRYNNQWSPYTPWVSVRN